MAMKEIREWREWENWLNQAEKSANCVLKAGVLLMSSGAEVYRVEETMNRLGNSIPGVDSSESYVMVTGIICSVEMGGQTVTRMARIHDTSRNLLVVSAVNELSRKAESHHYTCDQLLEKIEAIEHLPDYSSGWKALWGAIGAAGFSLFFGGGFYELGFVFLIGLIVRFFSVVCEKIHINSYFVNMFLAFLTAIMAVLFHCLVPEASQDIMIISSIMLLVPGLMITNALRDSVMDEPLSAVVILMQAVLIACAIAIGVLIGLYVMEALI